jgi:NAD-dependent DNA ligase
LKLLTALGFVTDQQSTVADSIEQVVQYTQSLEAARASLPYDIDGVVVKVNRIEQQEFIGCTSAVPRWAIAFKFSALRAETTVTDIQLQVRKPTNIIYLFIQALLAIFLGLRIQIFFLNLCLLFFSSKVLLSFIDMRA